MKILIRAAENKQRGRMQPAGRQFDMPVLKEYVITNMKVRRVQSCHSNNTRHLVQIRDAWVEGIRQSVIRTFLHFLKCRFKCFLSYIRFIFQSTGGPRYMRIGLF